MTDKEKAKINKLIKLFYNELDGLDLSVEDKLYLYEDLSIELSRLGYGEYQFNSCMVDFLIDNRLCPNCHEKTRTVERRETHTELDDNAEETFYDHVCDYCGYTY